MIGTWPKGISKEELVKSTQKGSVICTDETITPYFEDLVGNIVNR